MSPIWDPVEIGFADLDSDDPEEQMGSKDKYWVRLHGDDRRWLVKIARIDERDGTVSGEDWAEWLVQHLAALLGVPTASVRPAVFEGRRATVSRSILQDPTESLAHGNEILGGNFPAYDQSVKGENPGYTTRAVRESLDGVLPPGDAPHLAAFNGFDVWAGYLLLDAWVSGRDRHHENWGVIQRGMSGGLRHPSITAMRSAFRSVIHVGNECSQTQTTYRVGSSEVPASTLPADRGSLR